MPETPKSTFRFDDDTRKAIADLLVMKYGRDKTEVVARALVFTRDIVAGGGDLGAIPIRSGTPSVAEPKAVEFPFHPTCRHCGESFGAWNRNAALCPDCKTAQHIGEPRDCPACGERQGGL